MELICKSCALHDLVPLVQFEKREEHPWRSVNFSKVAALLRLTLFHGCFSRYLNSSNGTKSCNASQIVNDSILPKFSNIDVSQSPKCASTFPVAVE